MKLLPNNPRQKSKQRFSRYLSEDSEVCQQKIFSLGVRIAMPCFILFTNVPASAIPKGFLSETTKVIAKAIRKPEAFITVRIHPGQMMTHGGTTDPCASSEMQAIGHISAAENAEMSRQISEFLKSKLQIDNRRNYIKFTDLPPHEVGYQGTTFGELVKDPKWAALM
ncbi:macrophage migration inhibitory factor-like isoform X2 [Haliotis rubra]|uniref:macrophage migration inhibitory factor-like isoform X2 n=1 Tax=Haliotis rubra TaxID=36100 RepID=UPI001EE60666|nr:macrophage migration inhibitory factor-like isoform X2 [Haliotis rubra]